MSFSITGYWPELWRDPASRSKSVAPLGLKNPVLVGAMKPQASQPVSQSMWTLQQGVECPSDLSSDSSERVTTLRGILLGGWRMECISITYY